jgi:hypothetical protein
MAGLSSEAVPQNIDPLTNPSLSALVALRALVASSTLDPSWKKTCEHLMSDGIPLSLGSLASLIEPKADADNKA